MRYRLAALVSILLLSGSVFACGTPQITQAGSRVSASEVAPPVGCVSLGEVAGRAGGEVRGTFVDNDALVDGALNDVRNKASARGADYVQVSKPQLGVYYGSTRSAAIAGRAYRCTH